MRHIPKEFISIIYCIHTVLKETKITFVRTGYNYTFYKNTRNKFTMKNEQIYNFKYLVKLL